MINWDANKNTNYIKIIKNINSNIIENNIKNLNMNFLSKG